jgi:integrator complex subunit 8
MFGLMDQVPLLELLLYIHAKSGDEEQVTALIALLQQPALNVHNPPSIRIAHVGSLEQRFLQRFAGELL